MTTRRALLGGVALVVVAAVFGLAVWVWVPTGDDGTAAGAPPTSVEGAPAPAAGTWVLQQEGSSADLARDRPLLDDALSTPGVLGFSLRLPWSAADGDLTLADQGLALARAHGVGFSLRFMAGRWTPARVSAAGPTYRTDDGDVVPVPFQADGSPNTAFEDAYAAEVSALAAWCRANGVTLLHLPWWGQEWAELNHGKEVRAAPGYTYTRWFEAHRRLVQRAVAAAGSGITLEWPLSGYGPLGDVVEGGVTHRPSAELSKVVQELVPGGVVQANGWDADGVWGAPTATVASAMGAAFAGEVIFGLQSIGPSAGGWPEAYALARRLGARYVEVYAASFRDATMRAQVRPGAV